MVKNLKISRNICLIKRNCNTCGYQTANVVKQKDTTFVKIYIIHVAVDILGLNDSDSDQRRPVAMA